MPNQKQQETCLSGQPASGYAIIHVVWGVLEGLTYEEFVESRSCVGIGKYDGGTYVVSEELAESFCRELEKKHEGLRSSVIGPLEVVNSLEYLDELVMSQY